MLNRGKEGLVVDLKSPADRARLVPLLQSCDVVVEQFRPGVMDRLGLGYEAVRALNPDVIYCAISGYGQTGPLAALPDHDMGYQARTGVLALNPEVPAALAADIAGGSFPAVINVLLALLRRDRTGEGAYLDIAMADVGFTFALFAQAEAAATGRAPAPGAAMLHGGLARYRLYTAADGVRVAVAALEDKFWAEVVDATGLDVAEDEAETARRLQAIIGARGSAEWEAVFTGREACVSIVRDVAAAMRDPHFVARGLFEHRVRREDGATMPAAVVPIDRAFRGDPSVPLGAPLLTDAG